MRMREVDRLLDALDQGSVGAPDFPVEIGRIDPRESAPPNETRPKQADCTPVRNADARFASCLVGRLSCEPND